MRGGGQRRGKALLLPDRYGTLSVKIFYTDTHVSDRHTTFVMKLTGGFSRDVSLCKQKVLQCWGSYFRKCIFLTYIWKDTESITNQARVP